MTDYKCLEALTEKYKNYIDDESYVYKLCDVCNVFKDNILTVIVIMQKLENTKTNENRDNVINKAHAKFRANKLKVVEIVNIDGSNYTKKYIRNKYNTKITEYKVGENVYPDNYDNDIHTVCSGGIHYFKTLESAFFYRNNLPHNYTGHWNQWYENGQKRSERNYTNGERTGHWIYWYENGQIKTEGNYVNGKLTGQSIEWYMNGQKKSEGNYVNGERTGQWIYWYENGQKKSEGNYVNGKLTGRSIKWYRTGEIIYDEVFGENQCKIL